MNSMHIFRPLEIESVYKSIMVFTIGLVEVFVKL